MVVYICECECDCDGDGDCDDNCAHISVREYVRHSVCVSRSVCVCVCVSSYMNIFNHHVYFHIILAVTDGYCCDMMRCVMILREGK